MTNVVVTTGSCTDVGKVRDHNEDALLVTDRLWAVADGMGGHAAGEVASAAVIEVMDRLAGEYSDTLLTVEAIVQSVHTAHRGLHELAATHPEQRGMGTTLTGLALVSHEGEDRWAVFNVGDSRTYRLHDGELMQVTVDHSEVQELVDAGILTAAEAAVHPARNIITRSLGMPASLTVDVWVVPIEPEQTFLLCSDGLTNEVSDPEIADALESPDDPQSIAERLVHAANDHGGQDNITVIVLAATRQAGTA